MQLGALELIVDQVSMRFDNRAVLRSISLSIRPGEFVALVGPSGSGKSTLLGVLSGLATPTSGTALVHLNGKPYEPRLFCAWVPQGGNSMPTRTVLDNAALGGLGAGMDRGEARHAAIAALRIVGIDSLARKRANTLSGGELQRLAVARAACLGRKFVLADEPTGALDATTTDRVVDVLQALARRDMAVIVATHDTSVAEKCDRVLSLVDGALRDVS